jgi:hypothetical protein
MFAEADAARIFWIILPAAVAAPEADALRKHFEDTPSKRND